MELLTRKWGDPHVYDQGKLLFKQGWQADAAFFLRRGEVKLVRMGPDGSEAIVGLRTRGSFIATATALSGTEHPTTGVALTPCLVEHIPRVELRRHAEALGRFDQAILGALAAEAADLMQFLTEFRSGPVISRLERFLPYLNRLIRGPAAQAGRTYPLQKQEIAQALDATPEHVSRTLSVLARAGDIRLERASIEILKGQSDTIRRGA